MSYRYKCDEAEPNEAIVSHIQLYFEFLSAKNKVQACLVLNWGFFDALNRFQQLKKLEIVYFMRYLIYFDIQLGATTIRQFVNSAIEN